MQQVSMETWPRSGTLIDSQEIPLCKCLSSSIAGKTSVSFSIEQSFLTRGFLIPVPLALPSSPFNTFKPSQINDYINCVLTVLSTVYVSFHLSFLRTLGRKYFYYLLIVCMSQSSAFQLDASVNPSCIEKAALPLPDTYLVIITGIFLECLQQPGCCSEHFILLAHLFLR